MTHGLSISKILAWVAAVHHFTIFIIDLGFQRRGRLLHEKSIQGQNVCCPGGNEPKRRNFV